MLEVHWAEQALSEITYTVQEDDDETVAATVMSLIDFIYSLEYETGAGEEQAEKYALEVLPQEWHRIIKEASRIKRGYPDFSFFATREQRTEMTEQFAAYAIRLCNQQHGLFTL